MKDLFDFELAVRLEVCTAATSFPDDASACIGEIADGFRASGIDAEDVHGYSLC
jgi:hypothetical protein